MASRKVFETLVQRETKFFFPKTISLQQAQNMQKDHLTKKGLMVRKTESQTT